jgi:hypothetical protein
MSPIALSLDLLLMVLLIAAMGFGWRLDKRLKSLKQSHADFTGAIADLDRAAQRAETGLAQLRQATDEAVDLLAGRIEKARELTGKLERLTQEATSVGPRAANDTPRPTAERPKVRSAPTASPVDAVLAAESLARRLSSDDSLVLRNPIAPAASSVDDDLFEAPALAAGGGAWRRR